MPAGFGPELEQVAAHGQVDDLVGTTGHVARKPGQHHESDHEDDHLQEIGHGHRPHAAKQRVGQDGHHADGHAHGNADRAARQQVENQAQRRDLGRDPAQVAEHDDQRADDLDGAPIAVAVVVADGQQRHAVELAREEQAHQDQAHARAERVLDHAAQAALDELGGHAQHDLRAEPRGKRGGDDHVHGQMAPGNCEVGRVLDPPGRPQANGYGHEQVGDHH